MVENMLGGTADPDDFDEDMTEEEYEDLKRQAQGSSDILDQMAGEDELDSPADEDEDTSDLYPELSEEEQVREEHLEIFEEEGEFRLAFDNSDMPGRQY